jgi:hypothetical protein
VCHYECEHLVRFVTDLSKEESEVVCNVLLNAR